MMRAIAVVAAAAAMALSGAASAQAEPPPGTPCAFTLSPPEVVRTADGDMVSTTLTPAGCMGPFRPSQTVVCIQGADATTQCSQARGTDTAQVSTPYRAGATYTATGRGVGTLYSDMSEPNWQLVGPITAVL